jgi:FdhE protein
MAGERDPWAAHRRRAEVLRTRYGFASEVLKLYIALAEVWAYAWETGAENVAGRIVDATVAAGPPPLAEAMREMSDLDEATAVWLAGGDLPPVQRYLVRACLAPTGFPAGEPSDERHCPRCGGLPQLSFRPAGEPLVSEPRRLMCSRCAQAWSYSRIACAFCGETQGSKRTLYAEDGGETLPHLRIDACQSCGRYLIDVDLGRDRDAVPDVDELAALPLDLYAADQGLTKITPNIMGF